MSVAFACVLGRLTLSYPGKRGRLARVCARSARLTTVVTAVYVMIEDDDVDDDDDVPPMSDECVGPVRCELSLVLDV